MPHNKRKFCNYDGKPVYATENGYCHLHFYPQSRPATFEAKYCSWCGKKMESTDSHDECPRCVATEESVNATMQKMENRWKKLKPDKVPSYDWKDCSYCGLYTIHLIHPFNGMWDDWSQTPAFERTCQNCFR